MKKHTAKGALCVTITNWGCFFRFIPVWLFFFFFLFSCLFSKERENLWDDWVEGEEHLGGAGAGETVIRI